MGLTVVRSVCLDPLEAHRPLGHLRDRPDRVSCLAALRRRAQMTKRVLAAVHQTFRGIAAGLRARARIVWSVTAAVTVFNLAAPVIILSLARRPVDYFTFNPWLSRLPEYLASGEPLAKKLSFLSSMAIAWVSADNKVAGIDWGVIVDVSTARSGEHTSELQSPHHRVCCLLTEK